MLFTKNRYFFCYFVDKNVYLELTTFSTETIELSCSLLAGLLYRCIIYAQIFKDRVSVLSAHKLNFTAV